MFKLIIDNSQNKKIDNPETILELRKQFPSCYYKSGMYKEKPVIFVLGDLTTRKYAEPRQIKDGSIFFAPLDITKFDLSNYEVAHDMRKFKIPVKLLSGVELWVKPATLDPVEYSLLDDDTSNIPYSQATEYGKIAYAIYEDIEKGKDVEFNDIRVKKFIRLIISNSYSLPLVIFNQFNFISQADLMQLISAGLGISEDVLEVKKNI